MKARVNEDGQRQRILRDGSKLRREKDASQISFNLGQDEEEKEEGEEERQQGAEPRDAITGRLRDTG